MDSLSYPQSYHLKNMINIQKWTFNCNEKSFVMVKRKEWLEIWQLTSSVSRERKHKIEGQESRIKNSISSKNWRELVCKIQSILARWFSDDIMEWQKIQFWTYQPWSSILVLLC